MRICRSRDGHALLDSFEVLPMLPELPKSLDRAVKSKRCIPNVGKSAQLVAHDLRSVVEACVCPIQGPKVFPCIIATAGSIDVCEPATSSAPNGLKAFRLVDGSVGHHRFAGIESLQPCAIIQAALDRNGAIKGEGLAIVDPDDWSNAKSPGVDPFSCILPNIYISIG